MIIISGAERRGGRGTFVVPRVLVLVIGLTAFALTLPSGRVAAISESVERRAPDWAGDAINLGTGIAKWSGHSRDPASGEDGVQHDVHAHHWAGALEAKAVPTASHSNSLIDPPVILAQLACARFDWLLFAVDDRLASAKLNGAPLSVREEQSFSRLFELVGPMEEFLKRGTNVLEVLVVNSGGPGGLYVEGSLMVQCAPPPNSPPWSAEVVDLGTGISTWEGMRGLRTHSTLYWCAARNLRPAALRDALRPVCAPPQVHAEAWLRMAW
eukprot:5366745-Prymnesium_polylepis.1